MQRRDFVKGILSSIVVTAAAVGVYNDELGTKAGPDAAPDDLTTEIETDIRIAPGNGATVPDLRDFKDLSLEARDARAAAESAAKETLALPDTVPLPTARPVPEPELLSVPRPRPRPEYIPPAKPRAATPKTAEAPPAVAKEPVVTPRKQEAALQAPSLLRSGSGSVMLYNIHTSEKLNLDFRNIDKRAYNRFMRDFRRNETIDIDNRLVSQFGKVVQRLRQGGANVDLVELISGYRAPATNSMLQLTRGGQATNSQHTFGRAKDIRIPRVRLSALHKAACEVAHAEGRGGVGYYPKSSSNFVHMDVARLRFWG